LLTRGLLTLTTGARYYQRALEQIVGRERRGHVSHHDWSGDAFVNRAAASTQTLGVSINEMYVMRKTRNTLQVTGLIVICFVSCSDRLKDEHANQIAHDIRNAETSFRKNNGRYGGLKELVDARLLSNSLVDGGDADNKVQIRSSQDTYEAITIPSKRDDNLEYVGWTFYVDQSGVIRGRAYGKANGYAVANKTDAPVRYQ
jgi:hypothetical protein